MSRVPYLLIATAAFLWAVGGTYASRLIDRGASPVELTEARAWIAVAGIGLIAWTRRDRRSIDGGLTRAIPLLLMFGIFLALANLTYYLAIARLPVAVAIVIQYTAPGLIVLWKALVDRQKPTSKIVAALLLALVGVVLLSGVLTLTREQLALDAVGLVAAVASSGTFAAYVLTGEKVGERMAPELGMFFGFVVAGVLWLLVQAFRGVPDTLLNRDLWPAILFLGIVTTVIPFTLFLIGLSRVKASAAGIISTLEPVSASILALVFLGQRLTTYQLAGAMAAVIGIGVVQSNN